MFSLFLLFISNFWLLCLLIFHYRKTVGGKKVLVLVSGGVDSSVCAALLAKAIGVERVKALHIDNGYVISRYVMFGKRGKRQEGDK